MMADILNNKKFNVIVTELFIKGRKLNVALVSKNVGINSTLLCHKNSKQMRTLTNCI